MAPGACLAVARSRAFVGIRIAGHNTMDASGSPRGAHSEYGMKLHAKLNPHRLWWALFGLTAVVLPSCNPSTVTAPPTEADRDADGLTDAFERSLGTDPDDRDTDGDGVSDGIELADGTSPLVTDSDHDGVSDLDDPFGASATSATGSFSSGNDLEPNDSFLSAVAGDTVGQDAIAFYGRIDLPGDIDVFQIGPLSEGDRVIVEFERVDFALSPVVALYDADEEVFVAMEGTVPAGSPLVRLFDYQVRHESPTYYLGVTHPDDVITIGSYRLHVEIQSDLAPPVPQTQTIFLDFDGGTLQRSLLGVSIVEPFDGGAIADRYADDTDLIKQAIIERVIHTFDGLGVDVITSDEMAAPPEPDTTTVLLLGSFSGRVFGASESVDIFNEDPCDNGIVFTESFRPLVFGFPPTAESLGVAIGNVTAHEAGHLLGLHHVTDATALMDEASPAIVLLGDQEFRIAPLADSVFPLGFQNAPRLLAETVSQR